MEQSTIRRRRLPRGSERPSQVSASGLWARPGDEIPPVPENVTELGDPELMEQFRLFIAWHNFIEEQMVDAEIEEIKATNNFKVVEARELAAAEGATVTAKKAAARTTENYTQAEDRFVNAKARRKVLSIQVDALDRTTQFISRELSRRIGREPVARRQHSRSGA